MHGSPGHPAKHSWVEYSENPANQQKPAAKRPVAYYAHNERRPASDAASLSNHRTAPASDGSSDEYGDSRSDYSDDKDNFAVTVTPRR